MPGEQDIPNDRIFKIDLPAIVTGGGEVVLLRAPFNGVVTAAYWTPSAAVTANGTNYATLGVRNRTGAGAGTAHPATRSYVATNSVAWVTEAMTLDATVANRQFAAGDVLTVDSVATGTGVALPAGVITLHVQWR